MSDCYVHEFYMHLEGRDRVLQFFVFLRYLGSNSVSRNDTAERRSRDFGQRLQSVRCGPYDAVYNIAQTLILAFRDYERTFRGPTDLLRYWITLENNDQLCDKPLVLRIRLEKKLRFSG